MNRYKKKSNKLKILKNRLLNAIIKVNVNKKRYYKRIVFYKNILNIPSNPFWAESIIVFNDSGSMPGIGT